MAPVIGFAAGGWWTGLSTASELIAVLAALVVTVITLVSRIERQAGSILDHLTATAVATPAIASTPSRMVRTVEETLADRVALDALLRT